VTADPKAREPLSVATGDRANYTKAMLKNRHKLRWVKYVVIAPFILAILYVVYDGFWAIDFAKEHACRIDEAGVYPCIVDGHDWGRTLAAKTGIVTLLSFMAPVVILPFLLLALFVLWDMIVYLRHRWTKNTNA
jgi:hypothetical protein